tara:strand:+ start:222 stop:437 length:216 start_codon:yes stop_codon:yes gene_type:complete
MNYVIVDGKQVPVIPAKSKEEVSNKRTGQKYESKQEFDNDVANPETDTVVEDLRVDHTITVASLVVAGDTQ